MKNNRGGAFLRGGGRRKSSNKFKPKVGKQNEFKGKPGVLGLFSEKGVSDQG